MLREALARRLLSQGVIVTAHPNPRDADGFPVIYKPLDFDAFLDQIRTYLGGAAAAGPFPASPFGRHASGAGS
jgi:hypothetical protein